MSFTFLQEIFQDVWTALLLLWNDPSLSYSCLTILNKTLAYFLSCPLTDAVGQPVCDQCKPEYEGPNCVQCRDGYYNSDSICTPCDCNGNAHPSSKPRICHPDTGHCLNCSYNTTGSHCQYCTPGFIGDALAKNCTAIGKSLKVPNNHTPIY